MSVARDAETERVLAESKRLRVQLADAVAELDRYVKQLHEYLDRQPAASDTPTTSTTESQRGPA